MQPLGRSPAEKLTLPSPTLPYPNLQGARWDKAAGSVVESRPGEIYTSLPLVHFVPTKDYRPDPSEYSAPCYKTSTRAGVLSTTGMSTNYVISVELPTTADPSKWILAGAALLCQLND